MRITDAQVHIWLPESPERPWPKDGRPAPQMADGFRTEQLLALMDEAGVERAVLVPPSWEGERNDYVIEAAQRHPTRLAAMGRFLVDDRSMHGQLRAFMDQPGIHGVRMTFSKPDHQAWLADGTADWFWAEAEQVGMPVMVLAPYDMDKLDLVAARHPRLNLIIDHMGLRHNGTDDPTFLPGIAATLALARYPNVKVKLSSIPLYSTQPYPFADMTPHVRRLFEAYGPRRSFWGTDITRLTPLGHSYRTALDYMAQLDFLSPADREWVMGRGISECLGFA